MEIAAKEPTPNEFEIIFEKISRGTSKSNKSNKITLHYVIKNFDVPHLWSN